MYHIKQLRILCSIFLCSLLLALSCKQDPVFVAPTYVFMKWSRAIKNLNYRSYSQCEFLPKTKEVFMDIYGKSYFDDVFVNEVKDDDKDREREDKRGYKYEVRRVIFQCKRVLRKTGREDRLMRGEVDFIKFMEGPDVKRGWMMFNRTITRTGI